MKKMPFAATAVLMVIMMLSACNKSNDRERKNFTMTSTTFYRFSPSTPGPVTVNGTTYTSFAYVPGGGTGTATDMGNITTFYNQLAYTSNIAVPQPVPEGSVDASVSLVLGLAVTGGPLPLIQAGDFSALTSANSSLQVPATDPSGKIINAVIFNSANDAIFTAPTSASIITPVSATRFNFTGKLAIVGGRGKFANATGELTSDGFFNPSNPNEAGYNLSGFIEY